MKHPRGEKYSTCIAQNGEVIPAKINSVKTAIKICGVTTVEDAIMVAESGADAIGLNFYAKSSRYISPQAALTIIKSLSPFIAPVGVFVNTPMRQATAIAFQLGLRAIQTVDDSPATESTLPFAHIPAFRVADQAAIDAARQYCNAFKPSAILIDSHVPGQMGGTGQTAPWELLANAEFGVPMILAGGLTPENVAEAIRIVKPWAVDVASGVESSPGKKDAGKVKAFVQAVQRGLQSL